MNPHMDDHNQQDQEQLEGVHQPHDTAYKYLLSSKKLFVQLLRSFVQKGWVDDVNEANLEPVPHSFIHPDFKKKEADLVYSVQVNGQEVLFYFLVELQSRVDYRMAYRLLLYQVEVWRFWMSKQEEKKTKQKSFRLPPIVPIVLYNGKRRWTASRQFRQVIAREQLFGSQLIDFEYLLIDVVRYKQEDLLELTNTIGAVFYIDQARDKNELLNRLEQLTDIVKVLPEEERDRLFTWMDRIVSRKLRGSRKSITEFIHKTGGTTMSLEQTLDAIERKAKKEGKKEGKEEVAKHMLAEGANVAFISKVTGFSPEQIEQWRS